MSRCPDLRAVIGTLIAALLMTLLFTAMASATVSTRLALKNQFGREVNKTEVEQKAGLEEEDTCTAESGDTCQAGKESGLDGGFANDEGVAVGPPPANNVYVADKLNGRVEVFTPVGKFLRMFGWEVNKTKSEKGASQTERDVCDAGEECRPGQPAADGPSGQIEKPLSLSVDESTGDLYVLDVANSRVEKYTPEGVLVWMVGGEVNKTEDEVSGSSEAERNICTVASGDTCQAGKESAEGSTSRGAFKPSPSSGNLLAVGGTEDTLYVGDEGRVQGFDAVSGAWTTSVSLTSVAPHGRVQALGVDTSGSLYVVYNENLEEGVGSIHVISPAFGLQREIDPKGQVISLALDPFGRIAVIERTAVVVSEPQYHGVLFEVSSGKKLGEFATEVGRACALAFNPDTEESNGELYVADEGDQDVEVYAPVPVAVPVTGLCKDQTATTVTLAGEINPENIVETKAWFQYGGSEALGESTSKTEVPTGPSPVPLEATIVGLRPNHTYYYRAVGEDANFHPKGGEEPLEGETLPCETLYVAPAIEGEPASYYVTDTSVALSSQLNPENANTVYHFEYGPCESLDACAGEMETLPLESAAYGTVGVMQSATNLAPSTTYRYRLIAESENAAKTRRLQAPAGAEGAFTTLPAPDPAVSTGAPDNVTTSSATLTGLVYPGEAGATYSFQIGVYKGSGTAYGTVASGAVGATEGAVPESFMISGLQPGVTYSYRMIVSSAYVQNESHTLAGEPVTFTTLGLPTVLFAPSPAAMLPLPKIAFPKTTKVVKAKKKAPSKKKKKKKKKVGGKGKKVGKTSRSGTKSHKQRK